MNLFEARASAAVGIRAALGLPFIPPTERDLARLIEILKAGVKA